MAAQARGRDIPARQEDDQPKPESEPDTEVEAEEFVARLFAAKPSQAELVRLFHPEET
jgi:hypothetical protein